MMKSTSLPKLFSTTSVFAVLGAFALMPASAAAQQSSDEAEVRSIVDEIIVTAQRREQSLQEVPVAVTAISDDVLQDTLVFDSISLQKIAPSLTVDPGNDALGTNFRIRGVGANVFSTAVEPSVSVVVDGVVLARNSAAVFEFDDIERIEVLRGPQGTLFGKNSTAGLINVVTKDPSEEFSGSITLNQELDGPANQATRLGLGLSGPIADGLGFRLSGFYSDEPGYLEDQSRPGSLGDRTTLGLRGKLVFEPANGVRAILAADYQDSEGDGRPSVQRQSGPILEIFNGAITASPLNRTTATLGGNADEIENKGLNFTVEFAGLVPGHTLTSITGYREVEGVANVTSAALGPLPQADLNRSDRSYDTFSQEIQLTSGPGALEYTVGALYWENKLDNDFDRLLSNLSGGAVLLSQGYDNTVDTTNLGIYAQATYRPTERIELTGGLRYIDEKVDVDFSSFRQLSFASNGFVFSDTPFGPRTVSVSDDAVTGKLAARYIFNDAVSAYLSYSTGYKGRAFNLVTDTSDSDLDNPIEPETVDSFEAGLRSEIFGGTTILNLTAFHSVFESFQAQGGVADTDGNIDLILTNAGELETMGVELDIISRPTDHLSVFAAAAYTDAEFTDFSQAPCFGGQLPEDGCGANGTQDLTGAILPNAPEFKASFSTRYQRPISKSGRAEGFLTFGYRWQSETQFQINQNPAGIQDSYGIADAQFGLVDTQTGIEAAIYIQNLFDENYVTSIGQNVFFSTEGAGASRVFNTTQIVPRDAERIVGFRLRKDW